MSAKRRRPPKSVSAAYADALALVGGRPDVTGVDVGPKYIDGEATKDLVVRVHVQTKRVRRNVKSHELIPESIGGVPTDVVEARYRHHAGDSEPWDRQETVRPGISIGNPKAEAGTLGLIVFDAATGAPCLLSAFHVIAGPFAEKGDPITQPSRFDEGTVPVDTIGTLLAFFAPDKWGDAAVAKLDASRPRALDQFGSGVTVTSLGVPTIGLLLEKCGRTTGVTRGIVEGVGTYFYSEVPNGVDGFRLAPEVDDASVQDLSAPGDSGAIYYTPAGRAGVGLHCAGEVGAGGGEFAIACSLSRVMKTLGVLLRPPT